jgi:hypothetical protein
MPRTRQGNENVARASDLRTTIIIPETLDKNLAVFSLRAGTSKNEVIKTAIREFLIGKGLRPDEQPQIEVRY